MSGWGSYDYGRRDLPQSFDEARAIFEKRRAGFDFRKLAHNTKLWRFIGCGGGVRYAIRLHETDIVTFYADGSIRLHTGGWQTFTTRNRIRRCGVPIFTTGGVASITHKGRVFTYADGMRLHPDGRVEYPGLVDPDPERVLKRRRRALRRGTALHCDSRQSTVWSGGNVPEAFELDEEVAA